MPGNAMVPPGAKQTPASLGPGTPGDARAVGRTVSNSGRMEYRTLGAVGRAGRRAWRSATMMFGRGGNRDADECVRMVHRAIDAGVNLFDTADGYGARRQRSDPRPGRRRSPRPGDRARPSASSPTEGDRNRRGGFAPLDHACV